MSYAIATTSLSGATTDTTGTVDWTQIAQSAGFPPPDAIPHLALFNESPCGLQLNFQTGEQITLPAGGWQIIALNAQCTRMTYQVLYVLNASPIVADLLGTWYAPGEPVPSAPILGNSPIGGTVTSAPIANALQGIGQTFSLTEQDRPGVNAGPMLLPTTLAQALWLGNGNSTAGLRIDSTGNTVNFGNFEVFGATALDTTLAVTGAATLSSTVHAVGAVTMDAAATVGTTLGVAGAVTLTSKITTYNGEATVALGVPSIVAISEATLVTSTALQTPITYTTPNDGNKHSYRISAYFLIANGTSGNNLTYEWSYTDFTGVVRTDTGSMLGSTTGWGGGTSITNSRYTAYPAFFTANPNTTITVTFRDPTNTPHDTLSVFLERLS